jgi:asparagine synthase (glutamine-hydrolysing)
MCGICGQLNYRTRAPVSERSVREATATLSHRGPDDEGFYFAGPVGLGFRRLSIIDLAGGHQPMSSHDAEVWLVFNGEIYNFQELRKELQSLGHCFRTKSDTETIIYGYKQWGESVFDHLNGMFAIAIWDARLQKLVLARDGMGIKPVYYRIDSNTLSFGSEIRAVLGAAPGRPELDPAALNSFLQHRFTPSPLTLFKGVQKLAPGSMLVAKNGQITVSTWYRFQPRPFRPRLTLSEATQELASIYRAALKRHLVSDVPVGLLLSGGIDSSLLLALMAEHRDNWPTYTVGYGSGYIDDELEDARYTARLFKSSHVALKLTTEAFERYLPTVVSSLEEPVATSSIVPMYAICERARQDVKVALIGQGPDELFGGYTRHIGVHYGAWWRRTPAIARRLIGSVLSRLPRNASIKRGLYAIDIEDQFERFRNVLSIVPPADADRLFHDGLIEDSRRKIPESWLQLRPAVADTDELGAFQFLELRSTLPDELLVYADKLSMAHGLEVRVPYLDREVVEYAQCLDATLKVRYGRGKRVHRSVCSDMLPPALLSRRKRGFGASVVDGWFRQSMSRQMQALFLDSSSLMYRYLKMQEVVSRLRKHQSGQEDNHKILFSLVVLEWWLRSAVDSDRSATPAASLH